MKMTRRKLALAAFAPAAVALSQATSPGQAPASGEDLNALAQSLVRANSEILTKAVVPILTEPAFVFKA
jgi:hypothetical protein